MKSYKLRGEVRRRISEGFVEEQERSLRDLPTSEVSGRSEVVTS